MENPILWVLLGVAVFAAIVAIVKLASAGKPKSSSFEDRLRDSKRGDTVINTRTHRPIVLSKTPTPPPPKATPVRGRSKPTPPRSGGGSSGGGSRSSGSDDTTTPLITGGIIGASSCSTPSTPSCSSSSGSSCSSSSGSSCGGGGSSCGSS